MVELTKLARPEIWVLLWCLYIAFERSIKEEILKQKHINDESCKYMT